jgi:4a-hydroxytetrahydrobiopterin dehydratase
MSKLTDAELETALRSIPEWTLENGALVREWSFQDFVEAMRFVNQVALIAEVADHHPDIDVRYNRVRLSLVSHDAGGLTGRDVKLAQQLKEIASA